MRVFTATLGTETNTFAPMPTGLECFVGPDHDPRGVPDERLGPFAMPMRVARERGAREGWTVIEGKVAFAMPGGITTRQAYESLRDDLLADLRAALPVDMVLLGLHGAMVADGYDDAEGDLLARVRALAGPGVVIGAELDPHCHLTDAKTANADVLVCFKEYPHTDMHARAVELVDLCARTAAREIRPVMSVHDCEMISVYHTSRMPMRGFVDRMQALEGHDGVLSVSLAHGFPWADVPGMGTRVLVITDDRKGHGDALARRLADEVVGFRDALLPAYPDADAAIDEALATVGAPVVLADSADNPGGGASGDSTFVLRRLIARGVRSAVLGPLWDPVAVAVCNDAGEGARLALRIGGKVGPASGDPVDAEVEVLRLARGASMTGLGGTRQALGDVAVVAAGGIAVVLCTVRTQGFGPDLFTQFGIDPTATKIVVVKSSQHFHAAFAPLARQVIYVDTPGSVTMRFAQLPYRKARRMLLPDLPARASAPAEVSQAATLDAAPAAPATPTSPFLGSSLCRERDFGAQWYLRWRDRIAEGVASLAPEQARMWEPLIDCVHGTRMHRKLWEWCAITQALSERGMLGEGRLGMGFAVGTEPLSSLFAALGCRVAASDYHGEDADSGWEATGQLARSLDAVHWPGLIPREEFLARVVYGNVDMRDLSPLPKGQFDFVWSSCSLEHLGSLHHGLEFVRQSIALLRPGGVAVHTTEFNVSSNDATIERGPSVIYRRRDIEALDRSLRAIGCAIEAIDFEAGADPHDIGFDMPPYYVHGREHVKLSIDGHVSTSMLLIVRTSAAPRQA